MWPKGGQAIRVFDVSTSNFRKSVQEVGSQSRELVATDESPVIAKPFLDAIVVEDGQGHGRFPDATAIGLTFSARETTLSTSSSRPKQALGCGGGDSPSMLYLK